LANAIQNVSRFFFIFDPCSIFLNGSAILVQLCRAAEALKQRPEVADIYLFGSLVRGDYSPGSDADVAIILRQDDRRVIDRIPDFLDYFMEVEAPVDVFPYTLAEVERMENGKNRFWQEIVATGRKL